MRRTPSVCTAAIGGDRHHRRAGPIWPYRGPTLAGVLGAVAAERRGGRPVRRRSFEWRGCPVRGRGTGYTGEDGVESAVPVAVAPSLWEAIVAAGVLPAGLGARDTLRLEAGLPLHGHELGPGITPLQAGLGWVIGWDKGHFTGREAIEAERAAGRRVGSGACWPTAANRHVRGRSVRVDDRRGRHGEQRELLADARTRDRAGVHRHRRADRRRADGSRSSSEGGHCRRPWFGPPFWPPTKGALMGDYLPHTDADIAAMLEFIGLDALDDLFAAVPEALRIVGGLGLPEGRPEPDVLDHLETLAEANVARSDRLVCFAGGGAYDHEVPPVVRALAGRSEFVTSYTPYQPEVAQGVLQASSSSRPWRRVSLACRSPTRRSTTEPARWSRGSTSG